MKHMLTLLTTLTVAALVSPALAGESQVLASVRAPYPWEKQGPAVPDIGTVITEHQHSNPTTSKHGNSSNDTSKTPSVPHYPNLPDA